MDSVLGMWESASIKPEGHNPKGDLGLDAGHLRVSRPEARRLGSGGGQLENDPAAAKKDAGDCQDRGH